MNNEVVCAGCFARVGANRADCPGCGAGLWVGGRLRLIEPTADRRTRRFRGELRGADGRLQEVAVSVLEMGGLSHLLDRRKQKADQHALHRRDPEVAGRSSPGKAIRGLGD